MGKRSSVARHRARRARAGFVRVEISVRKEDAPLVRRVAAAPLARPMANGKLPVTISPSTPEPATNFVTYE